MALTVILIYVVVTAFLIYTLKNKKPLKWGELLPALNVSKNDDTIFIPGPLKLPLIGTKWQSIQMNKLHEYYKSKN